MSFGRLYHVQCRFLVPSWSDVHTCCLHVPVYISACTKRNVLGGSVTAVVAAGVVVGVCGLVVRMCRGYEVGAVRVAAV